MAALGVYTHESLGSLDYKGLQALAKCCGVKANLSKDKLIEYLLKVSLTLSLVLPLSPFYRFTLPDCLAHLLYEAQV